MLERTLVVGAGGFVGSAARYLVQVLASRLLPGAFPYGTCLVNVTGCFAIGFLGALAQQTLPAGGSARLFLIVGILGGYTTFSAFGHETVELLRGGSPLLAVANVVGQVVFGLLAVWVGAMAARGLP